MPGDPAVSVRGTRSKGPPGHQVCEHRESPPGLARGQSLQDLTVTPHVHLGPWFSGVAMGPHRPHKPWWAPSSTRPPHCLLPPHPTGSRRQKQLSKAGAPLHTLCSPVQRTCWHGWPSGSPPLILPPTEWGRLCWVRSGFSFTATHTCEPC